MRIPANLVCLVGLLIAGCTSTPPAELRTSISPGPAAATQDAALVLEVTGVAIDRLPAGWPSPLASRSTLITGPANELKAASPSPAESVVIELDRDLPQPGYQADCGSVALLKHQRILIPAGAAATIAVAAPPAPTGPIAAPAVEIIIRASPSPELLLRAERAATEEEELLARDDRKEIQTLRVPWPLQSREGTFTMYIPAAASVPRPTLWRICTRAASPEESAEAETLAKSLQRRPNADTPRAGLARSLRAARTPAEARRALSFASLDAPAPLTAEVVVLADDATAMLLTAGAAQALEAPGPVDSGWCIDRATLATVSRLHTEGTLDRALGAVLSARYGEAGRDASTLARFAVASATRADFEARLRVEHLVYLDDSSASARVRAYDWLISQMAAPAAYDPLGPARTRRDALDRHMQALEGRP